MSLHIQTNACRACAKSKRKCDRYVPSCARCTALSKPCFYASFKDTTAPSYRPLALKDMAKYSELDAAAAVSSFAYDSLSSRLEPESAYTEVFEPNPPFANDEMTNTSGMSQESSYFPSSRKWYSTPESWKVSRLWDDSSVAPGGMREMENYISIVQSWVARWFATGSNPFIHARLYDTKLPACLQFAHVALGSYLNRTSANRKTVLQIVEDGSNGLLSGNGALQDDANIEEWIDTETLANDLYSQMARLHALMVYSIIGLFDGDIRSRYVAEGHLTVQNSWAQKLLRSAAEAFTNAGPATMQFTGSATVTSTAASEEWRMWILSESIRRTWLVAVSMPPIFRAMQQRWASCPGGVTYTNRNGLWDAKSAVEWKHQCCDGDAAFLQRTEYVNLFTWAKPSDIDEFGTAMLDLTVRAELLQEWRSTHTDNVSTQALFV